MAIAGRHTEVDIKKFGRSVIVANDKRSKLMFYLHCICNVIKLDNHPEIQRLRRYGNYHLTNDQEQSLIAMCYLLSPDVLTGKCLFPCEEGDFDNDFYELSAKRTQFVAAGSILIGGQRHTVTKIMTFKMCWIKNYWAEPLKDLLEEHQQSQQRAREAARRNEESSCCIL